MAVTITAPVPVTHSGETDPALYPQVIGGSAFPDIVGANTTSGGSIKVTISAPEDGVPTVSVFVTATLLAYTTAGKLVYVPDLPGLYTVTVLDVSAAVSAVTTIEVLEG
jgi:hypothetical protein